MKTYILSHLNPLNMNPNPPIKLVIADDHESFRKGFTKIIRDQYPEEIEFVAEAANGTELVENVAKHRPQVVITDIRMPGMDGIQASKIIKQQYPGTAIIALSAFTDTRTIMAMLQAGVNGYLIKTSPKEEVMEAIQSVSRNEPYYCSTVSGKMYGTIVSSHQKQKKNKPIIFSTQESDATDLQAT